MASNNKNENKEKNICPNCGNPINPAINICIRCGTSLNIEPSENNNVSENTLMESVEITKEQKIKPAVIIDLIILLLVNIFMDYIICTNPGGFDHKLFQMTITLLISGSIIFYAICYQKLFIKAKLPWWGLYIPVYNIILIYKLMTDSYTFLIVPAIILVVIYSLIWLLGGYADTTIFITLAGILYIIATSSFAKRFAIEFHKLFLFPMIYIPILAFGNRMIVE